MLKVGPYELFELETGRFRLDGGAMFGTYPKTLWSKTNPADPENRIDMRLRCLLIRKQADASGPAKNILVDCGIGTLWSEKLRGIYQIDEESGSLISELRLKGLEPDDITDVILTHLHFDHAGGLTRGDSTPFFPKAKVYLQKRNWDNAHKPNERERPSYRPEIFSIYEDGAVAGRNLNLLDSTREEAIFPGVTVEPSHGHTDGMQIVRITHEAISVVYPADLVPMSSHIRLGTIAAYDCHPLLVLEEKRRLLSRCADEGSLLFYEHCPKSAASTVVRDEKGNFSYGQAVPF